MTGVSSRLLPLRSRELGLNSIPRKSRSKVGDVNATSSDVQLRIICSRQTNAPQKLNLR